MYLVISYDIKDDKRRLKIHKLLKNYGTWVQYSVFECNLQLRDFLRLRHRLKKLLGKETDDSIRFYGLCTECVRKIERIGGITPEEKTTVIV
jgi:CRISPR-associated protein Cas2